MNKLHEININEVVTRLGVSTSIISERDSGFMFQFLQNLKNTMGTKINVSTPTIPEMLDKKITLIRPLRIC